MKTRRLVQITIWGIAVAMVFNTSSALAQTKAADLPARTRTQKLETRRSGTLSALFEEYSTSGFAAAAALAKRNNIRLVNDRLVLFADIKKGAYLNKQLLQVMGIEVDARRGHVVRLHAPFAAISQLLSDVPGIINVRVPMHPIETVTTEGVALTNADGYHSHGWDGTGIKVAVIDGGFGSLSTAISNGEIPADVYTRDFTGTGIGGTTHGTQVAEIVYDMAPGAELYLMKISDNLELGDAVDTCVARGINVISHSMCWPNCGPLDGTGPVNALVDTAYNHDILWVNSAGNHAKRHYRCTFTDTDVDGWHEFDNSPEDELNDIGYLTSGMSVGVYLSWNDWWYSSQDYNFYIYYWDSGEGAWKEYAASETVQSGSQYPTEAISVTLDRDASYAVAIENVGASGTHEMTIFTNYYDLEFYHESSSILIPADDEHAFTVGAIAASQWATGPQASYSSQGPTYDSRVKPDIMGPSSVSVFTGGSFSGTSAAAPHVSGCAALLLSRFPSWLPDEVIGALESTTSSDFGSPGKDNIYGSGPVYNDELVPVELALFEAVPANGGVEIRWHTQSETENLGFDIYRSNDDGQTYSRINQRRIEGAGTTREKTMYSYIDEAVAQGTLYYYKLSDVDFRGNTTWHGPVDVVVPVVPERYKIGPCYPNPFNPETTIQYTVNKTAQISIRVYDIQGRIVKELLNEKKDSGVYELQWDGTDAFQNPVASGTYFVRMSGKNFAASYKVLLLK